MKTFFTLFLCFLSLVVVPNRCFSQGWSQHKIDSLTNVLAHADDDTAKVRVLMKLSGGFSMSEPEKGLYYGNQALALSQKLNFKKGIIYSYQGIAGYYYYKGDLKLASDYSMKAIDIIHETNDKPALSRAYSNLSSLLNRRNDYAGSLEYLDKALKIATDEKDSVQIAVDLSNKGMTYMAMADYTTGLGYFLKSLKINERTGNTRLIAVNYMNLGDFYLEAHSDYDKALENYELSLKYAKQSNDMLQTAIVLEHLGEVYFDKKQLAEALDCFQQALTLEKQIKNIVNIGQCMHNIAMVYNLKGDYDKALSLMSDALAVELKAEDQISVANNYQNTGEIYLNKKEYKTALTYLNKGLDINKSIHEKRNESLILKDIASCYELMNNHTLSYKYLNEYDNLKDSIFNSETIRKNAQMEALYNSERKDKEITVLTKDKQIQQLEIKKQIFLRNAFIAGVALLLVLFFFIYRSYHNRQLLKLQTLRTKIASDLHDDIGSTLTSISIFSLMARNESKEILPMLDQIGESCRKMLDSMADIVWTINPENDNFEKIISRMRSFAFELLRSKNIDFEFNADDSVTNMKLSMEARKNLFLIFKEATNNMVKYADANRATFTLTGSNNNFTMLIRDNGRGFNVEQHPEGNGLRNMKNRALEIGAKFLIESEPGRGTTIQLLFKAA